MFNVFPIRGEEYRDPRILLGGLDHLASLGAEHLVGVHGPPISGTEEVAATIADVRDAIAFLWDQTVRGINKGLINGDLSRMVQLPDRFQKRYVTRQFYGLVEHHVQQIHAGLRGWFDGDPGVLFKLSSTDEATRVIAAMGGSDAVEAMISSALDSAGENETADDGADLRWALRLATWLHRSGSEAGTTQLATALRTVAQRTTATNVRNWCLTTAHDLEGTLALDRLRQPVTGRGAVLANDAEVFVHGLRVLVVPERAEGVHAMLNWDFSDGPTLGLRIRDGVAFAHAHPEAGVSQATMELDLATWADLYSGRIGLSAAVDEGRLTVTGDGADDPLQLVADFFAVFDHPHLGSLDT